jgi:hypothetical protein
MDTVRQWFQQQNIDMSIFNEGLSSEALATFEDTTKIGLNIFYIGPNGPDETVWQYVSIYNNTEHTPTINLGYLTEQDKLHFVIITKLNCIVSEKYKAHKCLVCNECLTTFTTSEAILNHMKKYHRSNGETEIKLPEPDKAFINFDIIYGVWSRDHPTE